MRRVVAAGGLAMAACGCLLLFSGAAAARQVAGDTISGSGIANGTKIQFTFVSSGSSSISLSGGNNWGITSISSPGGTCNLTPTNNGGFCSFATSVTNFTINTTESGPIPSGVSGQTTFNDSSTAQFTAPVSTECHCLEISAEFKGFTEEHRGSTEVFKFSLKWKLHCATGQTGKCHGTIHLFPEGVHTFVRLHVPPASGSVEHTPGGGVSILCHPEHGTCSRESTGEETFHLVGLAEHFEDMKVHFDTEVYCDYLSRRTSELTVHFDGRGNFKRDESRVGPVFS
jgi:hypothetical protein